jgi:hypothetical protein
MSLSFLVAKIRYIGGAADPISIYSYSESGGPPQLIGTSFGAAKSYIPTLLPFVHLDNNVAHWNGSLWTNAEWGKLRQVNIPAGSGDWAEILDYSADVVGTANERYLLGIHPIDVNGEPRLITGWVYDRAFATQRMKFVTIDRDGVIRVSAPKEINLPDNVLDDNTGNNLGLRQSQVYDGQLHFIVQGSASTDEPTIMSYDPSSETLSQSQGNAFGNSGSVNSTAYTYLNGIRYAIMPNATTARFHLYKVDGPTWTNLGQIDPRSIGYTTISNNMQVCLFNNGTNLYALTRNTGAAGWNFFRITLLGDGSIDVVSDLTSTVLPAALSANSVSTNNEADVWTNYLDIQSNPGGPPRILLWYAFKTDGVANSQLSLYEFVDDSTELSLLSTGLDGFEFSVPHDEFGGGHRVWSGSGELDSSLRVAAIGSGIDLDLTIKGSAGAGTISAVLYYDNGSTRPSGVCTLNTIVQGAGSLNGNTIEGLSTGDDVTRVRWDALADGVQDGDKPRVVARTFI